MSTRLCATVVGLCDLGLTTASALAGDTLDRIKKEGVVRVGINNQYPFAFRDTDGTLTGFSIETTRKIFDNVGVHKIEPVVMDWASMIPGLKANRIDVIIAGMFIKPTRCEQAAFSNPDYISFDTLVVPKGNPKKLHSLDDVTKNGSYKVAAIQGGSSQITLKKVGVPEGQQEILPGYVEMFAALKAGRADAVMIDTVSAGKFLTTDPNSIERADPFQVPLVDGAPVISYGAYVFRLEDKELVELFNNFLAGWVGSPEQLAILKKYGLGASDVPPKGVTAAQVCAK